VEINGDFVRVKFVSDELLQKKLQTNAVLFGRMASCVLWFEKKRRKLEGTVKPLFLVTDELVSFDFPFKITFWKRLLLRTCDVRLPIVRNIETLSPRRTVQNTGC